MRANPFENFNPKLVVSVLIVFGIWMILAVVLILRQYSGERELDLFKMIIDPDYKQKKNHPWKTIKRMKIESLSLLEQGEKFILQFSFTTYVVLWACAEGIVIIGFVATLLSDKIAWVNYMGILSFIGFLIFFPRRSLYERKAERWRNYLRRSGINLTEGVGLE